MLRRPGGPPTLYCQTPCRPRWWCRPPSRRYRPSPGCPRCRPCRRLVITVTPSLALAPVSVAAVSAIPVGIAGAAVSTVKLRGLPRTPLPAVSVAVALTVCAPSCSGVAALYCQTPRRPPWWCRPPSRRYNGHQAARGCRAVRVGWLPVTPSLALAPVSVAAVSAILPGRGRRCPP
jgi:hypothetical protein